MIDGVIRLEVRDRVAVLTLNRPEKHNALDDAASAELGAAFSAAVQDSASRVILLRGEGRSFCAGRDVTVLGQRPEGVSDLAFVRRAQDLRLAMLDCPKPIVAALKGAAIGGGFEIALAADLRLVARSAKMSLPEIKYGLLPDTGGTQFLSMLLGPSRAKYLVMSGAALSAQQAFDCGVADWLVEDSELDAKAFSIATELAAAPPQALAMAKQLVDAMWVQGLRSGIRQELLAQCVLFRTEDYREARAALREQRAPTYTGR